MRVSVTDQGLGIPPEMIGKLFQRYYRVETKAHTSIKGTGLGLFFVKGVVEAHGGTVWVESQSGKGSVCFRAPGGRAGRARHVADQTAESRGGLAPESACGVHDGADRRHAPNWRGRFPGQLVGYASTGGVPK